MWVMAAIAVVSSIMSYGAAKSAAKAQTIVNKANAEAENTVRESRNIYEAASSALNNSIVSMRNQAMMKAAGGQYNAMGQNIVRNADQAVKGSIEQRLKSSEELGALNASISAMGMGGASFDLLDQTMRQTMDRGVEEVDRQINYQTNDAMDQRTGMIAAAAKGMDMSTYMANIDRSNSLPAFVAKPSPVAYLIQGITNAMPYISAGMSTPKPVDPGNGAGSIPTYAQHQIFNPGATTTNPNSIH